MTDKKKLKMKKKRLIKNLEIEFQNRKKTDKEFINRKTTDKQIEIVKNTDKEFRNKKIDKEFKNWGKTLKKQKQLKNR